MKIRDAIPQDAEAICAIYNHYVNSTVVTFEEETVTMAAMSKRIAEVTSRYPWLVCEQDGTLVGYAYATTWKTRSAYRFAVESAIYLRSDYSGRGIGTGIYQTLINELRHGDVHSVIAGIALPNVASIGLHEKLGFKNIGRFHEVGRKLGAWVDVGYWELLLSSRTLE